MRKKRLADWLEKLSVAFTAGAVLADKGFWGLIILGLGCLIISILLSSGGE